MWYRAYPALLSDAHKALATALPAGALTAADHALQAFVLCRRGLPMEPPPGGDCVKGAEKASK